MLSPITLNVQGETPAKKNSRITLPNGKTIPSKRYREWHSGAIYQLQKQWGELNRSPFEGEIRVYLHFFHSDNRRRDSDNGVSSIFDTLQDAGIIADDRWQIVREFSVKNYKSDFARCEIKIMEIEE
jgi:Holliday junction resolvase RusA-like endonuclease